MTDENDGKNIRRLEDSLINKIAAGEVIERPASVVKELVENSIDAGASDIKVEVSKAGKKRISVTDDGQGMMYDDAILSLERHATSKLSYDEQLFDIHTLGFRGEALASIAAVSRLSLVTNDGGETATEIDCIGGKIKDIRTTGAPKGTQVVVNDLFFNTPARKKYMRSDSVELEHIVDVVSRYSLANPGIYFRLVSDGKTLISSPETGDMLANIRNVYGKETEKNSIPLSFESEGIRISGYISKPSLTRSTKDHQSVFINKRFVRSRFITDAVYQGYHTYLMKHRHPFFVIDISIDPRLVDVNIHPSKREVKIRNDIESDLSDSIFRAVDAALKKEFLVPEAVVSSDSVVNSQEGISSKKAQYKYGMKKDTQSTLPVRRPSVSMPGGNTSNSSVRSDDFIDGPMVDKGESNNGSMVPKGVTERKSRLPDMRILGQINSTYIVSETETGMMLIDQHAAHERINYEKFMRMHSSEGMKTQELLNVQMIELTSKEAVIVSSKLEMLSRFGIVMESFGKDAFIIRSLPVIFGRAEPKQIVKDIIEDIVKAGSSTRLEDIKESIITTMSCRASIKGGEELTISRMRDLIDELGLCDNPFNCPHGRPVMISMSVPELEKKFKRVV